jgi:FecR protein
MKIGFGYGVFLAMAFSVAGVVAAGAQSGAAGEQSNPLDVDSASTAQVSTVDMPAAHIPAAGTPTADVPAASVPADNGARPGDSHVRIVRLSDVKGTLSLDRKTGNGFEQTMPNMPIIQGEKLRTADGYAEVEFEDNSTLRVAPNSLVEFPLLALRSSGAKASTIEVVRGMVYVNLQGTKGNEFVLRAGDQTMTVSPSTHMRMMVDDGKTVVSVFNGSVEVKHGSETTLLTKKESLTLRGEQVAVAKKIEEEGYDAWDKEANDYHARYSQANAMVAGGATYGLSDLNYYGNFINGGAFGSFWQPYLVGAGWNPYCNGVWAQYPGAGYSWVSPYPWGWLPYHTGTWSFFPGYGWGWQPGGAFNGLNNVASVGGGAGLVGTGVHAPVRAASPQAPTVGAGSLVLANNTPMVFSKVDKPGNFVFQKNSAGLGVPRGSLGSLNKISTHVEQHGSANMQVYAATPSAGFVASNHSGNSGPVSLRAGAPIQGASTSYAPASRGGSNGGSSASSGASHSLGASSASGGSSGSSGSSGHK